MIFEEGFYKKELLTESIAAMESMKVLERKYNSVKLKNFSDSSARKPYPSVFLSHKHSDLKKLQELLAFLEESYQIDLYIDSMDEKLPKQTSGETADRIKKVIKGCKKFILLATNDSVASNWCNWELGYGDAHKYEAHIALFPMKDHGVTDSQYKGREYMQIYPTITYRDGTTSYSNNGGPIPKGYYVRDNRTNTITPLKKWFES